MAQKEKQLLLIDLYARLPYGVMVEITSDGGMVEASYDMRLDAGLLADLLHCEDEFKPYLRPMSSMTEKEKRKYDILVEEIVYRPGVLTCSSLINFCYEHHLDDLGLIEKGLALEAPKDMYKTE